MPNILLGSEVVIVSVEDARKLVNTFPMSRDNIEEMQRAGVLDIFESLRSAVKRHDYERWERGG